MRTPPWTRSKHRPRYTGGFDVDIVPQEHFERHILRGADAVFEFGETRRRASHLKVDELNVVESGDVNRVIGFHVQQDVCHVIHSVEDLQQKPTVSASASLNDSFSQMRANSTLRRSSMLIEFMETQPGQRPRTFEITTSSSTSDGPSSNWRHGEPYLLSFCLDIQAIMAVWFVQRRILIRDPSTPSVHGLMKCMNRITESRGLGSASAVSSYRVSVEVISVSV
jgi:hypothetical protein